MKSMKTNIIIYLYNMGIDKSIKKEIDSDLEESIYKSITKYLGNREEVITGNKKVIEELMNGVDVGLMKRMKINCNN